MCIYRSNTARNIKFSHCEKIRKEHIFAYFRIAKISSFHKNPQRQIMRMEHVFAIAKICEKMKFSQDEKIQEQDTENTIFSK